MSPPVRMIMAFAPTTSRWRVAGSLPVANLTSPASRSRRMPDSCILWTIRITGGLGMANSHRAGWEDLGLDRLTLTTGATTGLH